MSELPGENTLPSSPSKKGAKPERAVVQGALEAEVIGYPAAVLGGLEAPQLRAFVTLARGMYTPGVHLTLEPRIGELAISTRLQEGRQYLETDAEILFSRYGTANQDWTLVGTVGSHAEAVEADQIGTADIATDNGIDRSKFTAMVNNFLQYFGNLGFADLPQAPGFSVVPLAVYRPIIGQSDPGSREE